MTMPEIGRMGFSAFTELSTAVGATGPAGAQGVDGVDGATGATGATGPAGADGSSGGGAGSASVSLHEEFLGSQNWATGTWVGGPFGLTATKSGTAAAFGVAGSSADATNGHLGILNMETGTTSTGLVAVNSGLLMVPLKGGEILYESLNKFNNLSTSSQRYQFRSGLFSTAGSGNPNTGVYFSYKDDVNSGNWTANYRMGGSLIESFDTGVAATTGWTKLGITVEQNVEYFPGNFYGVMSFYINGTLVPGTVDNPGVIISTYGGATWSSVDNHAGASVVINKTVGASSQTFYLDYIHLDYEFTTPR